MVKTRHYTLSVVTAEILTALRKQVGTPLSELRKRIDEDKGVSRTKILKCEVSRFLVAAPLSMLHRELAH